MTRSRTNDDAEDARESATDSATGEALSEAPRRRSRIRLVRKRAVWCPTWQGLLLLVVVSSLLVWCVTQTLHSFLACTDRVEARLLVVEGWVGEDDLGEILREFEDGSYERLCITGLPLTRAGRFIPYETHAALTAACLIEEGADKDKLVVAPGPDVDRHRTFESLRALRAKLASEGVEVRAMNVYTNGVHARRTQLVAQKVFGSEVDMGVVALEPVSYDSSRWWATSAGLKTVVMETISYAYEWAADGGRSGDRFE